MTPAFGVRLLLVAAISYIVFSYVFIPFRIKGYSMAPTYANGGVNVCFRWPYIFSPPERQQVVVIRMAGKKVMLLKRIVALQGETVEFREGRLYVNGKGADEPYLRHGSDWHLPPRKVKAGSVYVVGDNRRVPMAANVFGQTSIKRIMGVPLW